MPQSARPNDNILKGFPARYDDIVIDGGLAPDASEEDRELLMAARARRVRRAAIARWDEEAEEEAEEAKRKEAEKKKKQKEKEQKEKERKEKERKGKGKSKVESEAGGSRRAPDGGEVTMAGPPGGYREVREVSTGSTPACFPSANPSLQARFRCSPCQDTDRECLRPTTGRGMACWNCAHKKIKCQWSVLAESDPEWAPATNAAIAQLRDELSALRLELATGSWLSAALFARLPGPHPEMLEVERIMRLGLRWGSEVFTDFAASPQVTPRLGTAGVTTEDWWRQTARQTAAATAAREAPVAGPSGTSAASAVPEEVRAVPASVQPESSGVARDEPAVVAAPAPAPTAESPAATSEVDARGEVDEEMEVGEPAVAGQKRKASESSEGEEEGPAEGGEPPAKEPRRSSRPPTKGKRGPQ